MNRTKYLKGECGQCGGHLEFPAEATGLTTDCPHCGKPTELLLARPREEPAVSRRVIVWTASAARLDVRAASFRVQGLKVDESNEVFERGMRAVRRAFGIPGRGHRLDDGLTAMRHAD